MKASCCKPPHDGWTEEIGALLVTDANENPHIVSPVPLPFWSNMFYYYIVDPYFREAGRKYHVVRTDRPDRRDSGVPLVRREIAWVVSDPEENEGPAFEEAAQQAGIVRKEPRQGMFDNVHLAPRLRLMNVKEVGDTTPKHLIQPRYPIEDRAEWHLDDIVMAPFCAHDCLHMHWRWSAIADKPWSLGWDATGPHRAAGAPMVPLGHDVWLRFRRRNAITYHVLTTNAQPTLDWHVLLHHGFGFAVAISDKSNFGMAMFAIDGAAHVYFIKEGQPWLFANESTSAYYWMARFAYRIVDDKAVPRERLSFPSADLLQQAIDL